MATTYWTGAAADGDWSNNSNWSGSAPANGDDVFVESGSDDIDTGLAQSAVALSSLNIAQDFTGTIGTSGTALAIGSSEVNIGYSKANSPTGSGRIHLDLGSATAAQVVVYNTGRTPADTGSRSLRIIASNASTDIFVRGGLVEVAGQAGETTTIGDLTVDATNANSVVQLGHVGANAVTCTNINVSDGTVYLNSLATTVNVDGGTVTTEGDDTVTTVNVRGGSFRSNATGTITTLNARGGVTEFTRSSEARTVTTLNLYPDAIVEIDTAVVTLTNNVAPDNGAAMTMQAS
jgi:hypothetical protein